MSGKAMAGDKIACPTAGLERWFLFDEIEDSYEISAVTGRVPDWLRGSWYINGPARFERAGARYTHWLDGDGMVCSLRFAGDGVRFTNRFIRTPKFTEEEAAGHFLYRGFGTAFRGDRLRRNLMLESPVNVSVYPFAGRLLAMGEQTLPYELDPITLDTLGEYDFNGALNEVTPFSAHAKFDRGLLNFGVAFSGMQPHLNVFEFDNAGSLLRRRRYPLPHPYAVHDFGFTPHRVLFFLSPLLMNFGQFLRGASVMDSLTWQPELGSRILVVPRAGLDAEPFTLETGCGYCLHFINCFEEDGRLVIDVLLLDAPVYPEYQPVPNLFVTAPRCRPARYVIDTACRALVETCALTDYELAQDFPSINVARAGRAYNDFWMLGISELAKLGRKFFDQLAHGSWESGGVADIYTAPRGEYLCGEPCFAANPCRREEAVVICERFSAASNAASILLFDAFQVRGGPIASIPLRRPVHPGFHTSFIPFTQQEREPQ